MITAPDRAEALLDVREGDLITFIHRFYPAHPI